DDESGSESDEDEDENGELLTPALDLKIMRTINMIRNKDPRIYEKSIVIFDYEKGSDNRGGDGSGGRQAKPMKYKDLVRAQVVAAADADDDSAAAHGGGSSESDNGGPAPAGDGGSSRGEARKPSILAYDREQQALRESLLDGLGQKDKKKCAAANDGDEKTDSGNGAAAGAATESGSDDDDEPLLRVREKSAAEQRHEEIELAAEVEKLQSADPEQAEADAFLRDFVLQKRWVDHDAVVAVPMYDEVIGGGGGHGVSDSEDGEEVDRADAFEARYNFRFEEDGGGQIVSHARRLAGTVRRPDDKRKRERAARRERKEAERRRKEEELRRLKNIKREAIEARLKKITAMSGGATVDADELDADFDPDRWDASMAKAFGDGYYDGAEADDGWKPSDDPMKGLENDNDGGGGGGAGGSSDGEDGGNGGSGGGSSDGEEKSGGGRDGDESSDDNEDEDAAFDDDDDDGEGRLAASAAAGAPATAGNGLRDQKACLLDELYKLDYEDIIGDLPCRFKYRSVKPDSFGLEIDELLVADDAALNQYISVKKLAPYREGDTAPTAKKRKRLRQHVREAAAELEEKLRAAREKARGRRRRGRRQGDGGEDDGRGKDISAGGDSDGGGAEDTNGEDGANGTTEAANGGGGGGTAHADEPVGGRRKRRKKAGKKVKKGGGGDGGGDGEEALVPPVQAVPATDATAAALAPKREPAAGKKATPRDIAGAPAAMASQLMAAGSEATAAGTSKKRKRPK
ncbi:unnamed protein product, partial [Phaeothamnion confervicola]